MVEKRVLYDQLVEVFIERLIMLLGQMELTGKQISELSGVSESHISRIINRKREPNLSVIIKILSSLKIEISSFFDSDVPIHDLLITEATDDFSTIRNNLSANLKQIQYNKSRGSEKLTQEKLAEKLEKDTRDVQRLLNGEKDMTLYTLLHLSDALGIEVHLLFLPKSDI